MALSREIRRLQAKWASGEGWPKRLEWIELDRIRGWANQRIDFKFPIVALVGENGVGKSTVLQAIASAYAAPEEKRTRFASDFFPDTAWDRVGTATIRFSMREGGSSEMGSVRKPTGRWRGNPERKKRIVDFVDLRRVQPVAARVGYPRLAKSNVTETSAEKFDQKVVERMSHIMGRKYESVRLAITNVDKKRKIPVVSRIGASYSGFHSGAGEVSNAELLGVPIKKYSVFLIDEIETSLHPRTQRRLLRDLADVCREQECQIVLTTHSPYILEELPPEGRLYIMDGSTGKSVIAGVSAQFAMTRMDDEQHPECDVYVEDDFARVMLQEIIVAKSRDIIPRIKIVPFGAASVGRSLGIMASQKRFPRPSVVFLDGDQSESAGCYLLPGGDAPERVIFEQLHKKNWAQVPTR